VGITSRKDGLYGIDLSGAAWRKSSYSNGGEGCVEITEIPGGGAAWRKSSHSNGGENCVEMADLPGGIAVRDSKDPERAPLRYTVGEWHAFCRGVIEGAL
jgi:hypothetical protein